jgi:hypothetical protein
MPEYGWANFIREKQIERSAVMKTFALSADRLARIKSYEHTRRIRYPEYKEAFDYVHNLYPAVGVKQAFVYHSPKHFLKEVGYGGVGGFYDTVAKVVVITDWLSEGEYNEFKIDAEFTPDEVLCHELIHYCANYKLASSRRVVEEEIAYGKSIGYLRMKGRTDQFIIEKNMLPYLLSTVDKFAVYRDVLIRHYDEQLLAKASVETINKLLEPLGREIFHASKAAAIKLGEKMIAAYGGAKVEQVQKFQRQLIVDDFE